MGSKFIINFDVDGVLLDTTDTVFSMYFNENYSEIMEGTIPFPLSFMSKRWDMSDELVFATKDDINRYFQSDLFFNFTSFITDPSGYSMKNLFEELIMDNRLTVKIATKGTLKNLNNKREFFKKEVPIFNMDNFIGLEGVELGKESIKGFILIDDVLENLIKSNVKYRILFAHRGCLDKEYNMNYENYPNIIICTTVSELCDKIIELVKFEEYL